MSDEPSKKAVSAFCRAYVFCTWLTSFLLLTSAIGSAAAGEIPIVFPMIAVVAAVMIVMPMIWQGGIRTNLKWATLMATDIAALFSLILAGAFIEFVATGGGEGLLGEGSPLASILAMVMFAALIQGPWLLTALRGRRVWRR